VNGGYGGGRNGHGVALKQTGDDVAKGGIGRAVETCTVLQRDSEWRGGGKARGVLAGLCSIRYPLSWSRYRRVEQDTWFCWLQRPAPFG
jgi:hypothetical protein